MSIGSCFPWRASIEHIDYQRGQHGLPNTSAIVLYTASSSVPEVLEGEHLEFTYPRCASPALKCSRSMARYPALRLVFGFFYLRARVRREQKPSQQYSFHPNVGPCLLNLYAPSRSRCIHILTVLLTFRRHCS